ncbi:MAG: cohesin domain-containing protein [Bryobacteraceae bacterium]
MIRINQLSLASAAIAVVLAAGFPAAAKTRKGEKLLKDGQVAEAKRDFDRALELYEQAVDTDPSDAAYQLAVKRVRFQAGQAHVERGMKLRDQGKLEEAAAEFERAIATDPGSAIAISQLKRVVEAIKKKNGSSQGTEQGAIPDPGQEMEERLNAMQAVPELKPLSRKVSTLKMNNQPVRVLFETLAKLAGLNVIWDPEYQSTGKNYSVDLSNTTLDEALNHLSLLTKTYWKPISENTVFLTNDNVTKRRDYEEMVVKTFYLKNLTTPQELQEIATILRTMTDIRRVFTFNSQNVIMVRGEVDKVALAEKLVADLDKPKAEVVIDVFVMEANRTRTRDLAATFVSGGSNGLRLPVSFVPRDSLGSVSDGSSTDTGSDTSTGTGSSTALSGAVRLTRLGDIRAEDFALSIPNALLQALMSDRGTRVLQSPQIRATHGVKSSLKIGDRFPYATGSFQPGVGAVGVSPLVSTQFQFADVGVNVDIQPTIHGAEEVTLQVEVDISNIRDRIDVGGLAQPVIGQRKFTHTIRLMTGEVSLLGGLRQDQDTRGISGTPGLGNLPVIGRLFSGENVERTQGELLIALVPHIVRAPEFTDLNLRGIAAGSDTVVRINYASKPEPAAEPRPAEPAKPAAESPAKPPAGTPAQPGGLPMPLPGQPAAPPSTAAPPATGPKLTFAPGQVTTKVSASHMVTVMLNNVSNASAAPVTIRWDPKVLRLTDAIRGSLMDGGGQMAAFTRDIRNDQGEAVITIERPAGATPVSGSGVLVNLMFQAIGAGSTDVNVIDLGLRDAQQQPVPAELTKLPVKVE